MEGPVEEIKAEEVKKALKKMKNGKAAGPTQVTADLLKAGGDFCAEELAAICRRVAEEEKPPDDWKDSWTSPIYKGKGDALLCEKHRGIRLLEHAMKVYEKVLEGRLREILQIDSRQFGFMSGKSTIDAIFILRQLQEKYREKKRKLYHVFVDLEKAFDCVPREVIEWALRRQRVPEKLVRMVMLLYEGTTSRVKTVVGKSEKFKIGVGVHQGSALSPLLFIAVMEEAIKEFHGEGLFELLYADDLVLTGRQERRQGKGDVCQMEKWYGKKRTEDKHGEDESDGLW